LARPDFSVLPHRSPSFILAPTGTGHQKKTEVQKLAAVLGRQTDMLFHVGGDEASTHSPRAIKRDFRALGWFIRESGVQVIFSSLPPVTGSDMGRDRWAQSINT